MKSKVIFLICLTFSLKILATAQNPDYLLVGKDTLKLFSNPLEQYFKIHPLPDHLMKSMSSGNWRGYTAYFRFEEDKLVVDNIYKEDLVRNNNKSTFLQTSIYKEIFGDNPNFPCDFFSGVLICPYGEMIQYVHMAYGSLFESYKLFEIQAGSKVKSKDMTAQQYDGFKREFFKYFKTTEKYQNLKNDFMQLETDPMMAMPEIDEKPKVKKKENKYLKQKEHEYESNKLFNSFIYLFLEEYITTIDIPKKT